MSRYGRNSAVWPRAGPWASLGLSTLVVGHLEMKILPAQAQVRPIRHWDSKARVALWRGVHTGVPSWGT